MFCSNCGQENSAEDRFCIFCGAELIDNHNFPDSTPNTVMQALWDAVVAGCKKVKAVFQKHPQIAIPVALVVACGVGLSIANATVFSGKRAATKYFLSMMNNDGSAVYQYLDLPESDFVNMTKFNDYFQTLGYKNVDVGNYQVTEVSSSGSRLTDSGEEGSITTDYEVTYYLRGDSGTRSMNIKVVNIPRFFGLLNSYKVISSYVATDYQVNVPTGSTVIVDDITLSDPVTRGDCDSYTIPSILCTDHTITINHPFGTQEGVFVPSSGSGYGNSYDCDSLPYNTATTEAVFAQAQAQFSSILNAAVARQAFPADIAQAGDADAQSRILEEFYDLQSDCYDVNNDTGYITVQITSSEDDSYQQSFSAGSIEYQCVIDYDYNYIRRRKNWYDEVEMQNGSDYGEATLTYVYENGAWVLEGFTCYL